MFPPLSKSSIQRQLGSAFFGRGRDYAERGRVLSVEVGEADEGWRVTGEVSGTGVYRQEIHLLRHPGEVTIEGECSCPVAYNCKHVAAVLIVLLERGRAREPQRPAAPYSDWLEQLAESTAAQSWPVERGDQAVIYLLQPGDARPWALDVEVEQVRLLKHGGFGKPRLLYSFDFSQLAYSPWVQPADREILRLLGVAATTSYRSARLEGAAGALALRNMVQTGRLYCRSL